jgi:ribonucleotide reductase beta subunit family protein with ferritin-like domain
MASHRDHDEPILNGTYDRLTLEPVQFPDLFELFTQLLHLTWSPRELPSFETDTKHFKNVLTDKERQWLTHVLAFFAVSDSAVMENSIVNFQQQVKVPEAQAFFATQAGNEACHQWTYSLLITSYIKDAAARERAFNAVQHSQAIKAKFDWMQRWMDPARPFAQRLLGFACVEGLLFSASFASVFYFKSRNVMPNLCISNEW